MADATAKRGNYSPTNMVVGNINKEAASAASLFFVRPFKP